MAKSKVNRAVGISPGYERDWQAEGDCDTLMRACEIRKDPKRLKAAKRVARERLKHIKEGVTGIEKKY